MIKDLTNENDKMGMIKLIAQINERISIFFKNKTKSDSINILNINGVWGSGKSTIINNLEKHYNDTDENNQKQDMINWVIINLWEYETVEEQYYKLISDLLFKITKEKDITKEYVQQVQSWTTKLIFNIPLPFLKISKEYKNELTKTVNSTDSLTMMHEKVLKEINETANNRRIVIIFDELDRCLPQNQVKLLSYIKNIFLKINNIFYIVASNNELINYHLNGNKNIYSENYTDKIFEMKIDLKDIFLPENNNFTDNQYIKAFQDNIGENNARLMTNLLKQVEKNITYLKKIDINELNFWFLNNKNKDNHEKAINHIEALKFIIFYCYYLKNKFNDDYKKIIKLTDKYLITSDFFSLIKNEVYSELNTKNKAYSDSAIKVFLTKKLTDEMWSYVSPEYISSIKLLELSFEDAILNKINKEDYKFNLILFIAFIPFFGTFLKKENINLVWTKKDGNWYEIIRGCSNSSNFDKFTRYILDIKKLPLNEKKHFEKFFNIISKYRELQFLFHEIGYIGISKIIESSIFDY